MKLNLHRLKGCSPAPLAMYLKGLGILRIIAEQTDSEARGWWQDEHFCLLTKLNREELEHFFLEEYKPSAIFNPWGARSGFYDAGSEKTSRTALTEIERCNTSRLVEFQSSITQVRKQISRNGGVKPEGKEAQNNLVRNLHKQVRGPAADWLKSVLADLGDKFVGPPIFGTGGNEGSGGYSTAYFAAIVECIVRRSCDESLMPSLMSVGSEPLKTWDGSFRTCKPADLSKTIKQKVAGPFRQFLPEGESTAWDLLFSFEGALAINSSVTQRSKSHGQNYLSSPFYFSPHGVGAFTSCDSDEFEIQQGRRMVGRGEQWFPLWKTAATYFEVTNLICSGKCSVKRGDAKSPIDAARSISRLGISRGISEFIRFGYYQRNNLATHFAVPLGRIRVPQIPIGQSHLIDDIAGWMNTLQRLARDSHAPARLVHAERRLANAVFEVLTHDDSPARWQSILEACVDIESIQAGGTAINARPIPKLKPEWIVAINDNSPEVRLALALGGAAGGFNHVQKPFDSIRHHWLPLEHGGRRFQVSDKRLVNDPRVVAGGRDPFADCSAVVQRRLIEAETGGKRRLPIKPAIGCGARLNDLALLIDGHVDLERVVKLGRALTALDWSSWSSWKQTHPELIPGTSSFSEFANHPDETWLALRLSLLPWQVSDGIDIPAEPSVIRRLLSDDGSSAVQTAIRRLAASGIRTPFSTAIIDTESTRLWAAALVFPISQGSAQRALKILTPDYNYKND